VRPIDLNADVGEGFGRWTLGDDDALMGIITSANVACGFHAGDPSTIRRTCAAAVRHGVAIGAQVAYPDLVGFGRRFIDIDPHELADAVVYQIGALDALARVEGGRVAYVKPHGALYHAVLQHEAQAEAVASAVHAVDPSLPILGMANAAIEHQAVSHGLRYVLEGFADRGYDVDGRLVPRGQPSALLTDAGAVAEQAVALLTWRVESICVHSDTPGAAALALAARRALEGVGAVVASFAG
jgi:UPF0271 protein